MSEARVRRVGVLGTGLVDPAAPLLVADDLGLVRGDGVFETVRVRAGVPVVLRRHLQRLAVSAERLGLPAPDVAAWLSLTDDLLESLDGPLADDAALRLLLTRGPESGGPPTGLALLSPVAPHLADQRRDGVRVLTRGLGVGAGGRAGAPWLLGGVKSLSYAMNMAVLRDVAEHGADDALLVSSDGEALEGPTSTLVVCDGDELLTPPPEEVGTLPGTTAAALEGLAAARGLRVVERRLPLEQVRAAQGAALVSSVRGVAPVVALDARVLEVPDALRRLRDDFEDACARGRLDDR